MEEDLCVAEIEFATTKGLEFIHERLGVKNVYGLSKNQSKIHKVE